MKERGRERNAGYLEFERGQGERVKEEGKIKAKQLEAYTAFSLRAEYFSLICP